MMKASRISSMADSIERSLRNCSLDDQNGAGSAVVSSSSSSRSVGRENKLGSSDSSLELNSHISLPYHWEQCLDLETGEIYYINWKNGMKAKEDPRTNMNNADLSLEESEEEEEYGSEEEYSLSSSSTEEEEINCRKNIKGLMKKRDDVLVVAGCKSCFMYFMVPKQVDDCPKCRAQLLHFDHTQN